MSSILQTLVYHHLLKVAPNIAYEFRNKYDCSSPNLSFTLKSVVVNLQVKSVVYNHLMDVTPKIAKEFKINHPLTLPLNICLKKLVSRHLKEIGKNKQSENEEAPSIPVVTLSDDDCIQISSESELSNFDEVREDIGDSIEDDELSFFRALEEQFACVMSTSSSEDSNDDFVGDKNEVLINTSQVKNVTFIPPPEETPDIDFSKNFHFRHISESSTYTDLRKRLKENSIVDQIVFYILNKDIKITQLNLDHIILSGGQVQRHIHNVPAGVKLGSFSPKDNNIILSNWEKLVSEMNMNNPEQTFKLFCKRRSKDEKLKANILGLYLSQGMEKLRLAADVFYHSERKILNFVCGKISPSEHSFIMDFVSSRGVSPLIFNDLAKILNRRYPDSLRRYYNLYSNDGFKKGTYTMLENKLCIREVMEQSNIKTILEIKSAPSKDRTVQKRTFEDIAKQLGRPVQNVTYHWEQWIKPLLLQYHAGTVNYDVRRILANHLLDKDLVFMQDIPWDELLLNPQFAGHTKLSLNRVLNDLIVCTQRKHNCKREEVTIKQIADFANDKFDPHRVKVDGKSVRQKLELVEYYKSLIGTTNI